MKAQGTMKTLWVTSIIRALSCALLVATVEAGSAPALEPASALSGHSLSNLTPLNFFTAGWDEPYQRRPHPDGAPDLSLLRVQTNLLVRTLRTDYFYERPLTTTGERNVQYLSELVEWAFNRRLMLAVFGTYQSVDERLGEDRDGTTWGGIARFQLVDTLRASYALNLRVVAPNDGLGEEQTTLSVALAGWHDLAPLGLGRTGLYWHVQEETFLGPHHPGTKLNDLTYALTLAHTWTSPDALLGNLTTFVEAYAKTDLDGAHARRTTATITPGFRFTLAHHHTLIFGAEIPVTTPRPYEQIFRVSYLCSF